jgi:gluconate 5-dehydrogenase
MNIKEVFDLGSKTAVVTGGSAGLGAQMATALAEAGANVVIAARKIDRCITMCKSLEKTGVRTLPVACDVAKIEDCQNLVDTTVNKLGTLDILVNNAGSIWVADSMTFPMEKWQRVISLNITGTFQLSTTAAKIMKQQGGGKIVNIGSIGALGGDYPENANSVAYTTSKGGIIAMTKDLAVKWARHGIHVNAICPGWFLSGMNEMHLDTMSDKLIPRIPLGRYGGNEDLKGVIVFLCSRASDYITGQYIVVDGGQTAMV